jgi:glyoxylase-like metal-dependent hydrolase (beta-lactamase superfamily II)
MEVKKFQFNPFPVNTYVVWDEASRECAIIDPGCYRDDEVATLEDFIASNRLKVKYILLTHLHLDHALAVPAVKRAYPDAPFCASKQDEFLLAGAHQQAAAFGLRLADEPIAIDQDIKEGDRFRLGNEELVATAVPGHSPGSIVFILPGDKKIFCGDVLFRQSIGRTDLPGGDYLTLLAGIKNKLFCLPDETVVYSGHGPETSIGYEKQYNPYV